MTAPSAKLPRYATLDHWRGIAALSVVLFHVFHPWEAQRGPAIFAWLTALAEQGYRGVHLFFVISGYCIAHLSLSEFYGRRDVSALLRQRFLRIIPPYWIACLVAALLALASLPFNHASLFASSAGPGVLPSSFGSLLSHAFLLDVFLGRGGYLVVAWTLSWEILYYLLAALVLGLALRTGKASAVTFALVLATAGAVPAVAATLPPLSGWSEFMCGACLFFALESRRSGRSPWPWLTVVIGLGISGAILSNPWGNLSVSALFALTLFALHRHDSRLVAVKLLSWLGYLGAMSYSIYLIHVPVGSLVNNLLGRVIQNSSPFYLLPLTISLFACMVASWLFFLRVETPIENWRRSRSRLRSS